MKKIIILSLAFYFCFFFVSYQAQEILNNFNFDFEQSIAANDIPDNWIKCGTKDYTIFTDSLIVFSKKKSVQISSRKNVSAQSFGCIAYMLPANYSAEYITLKGYMKTENVEDGYAGLILRIDGSEKPLAFNNMYKENIQGTNDWKQYEITLPFSEEAKGIFIAGLLTGKGKAWFDNFQVLLDDTDISKSTQIIREVVKAELDVEFDEGSNLKLDDITEQQIESLHKIGKVWGYLKYYHPTIAEGNLNWDYELIRLIKKVTNSTENLNVNLELYDVTKKLGEISTDKNIIKNKNVKLEADIAWIKNSKYLGAKLSDLLMKIKSAKRGESNHYISFAPGVGNPIFQNERSYSNMRFNDDGLKIVGLFRYWNIIQYYFPYRHLIEHDWEKVLTEFIPKVISSDDELSYKLTLLELISKINDTHANIWQKDVVLENYWGIKSPPIKVKIMNEKVVVTEILNTEKITDVNIGDVIIKIENRSTDKIIREKIRYCPASNLPTKYRDVASKLIRTNKDSLLITIVRNQKSSTITLKCIDYDPQIFKKSKIKSHKILADNIGYIYSRSLLKGEIDTIMTKLSNTNGLIIDLRCYPSDFIVFRLGKYLMPEPIEFVKFTTGSLTRPGEFSFTPLLKVGESNNDYYKGKVVILINETTQSQAEYTAMALRVAPNAIVVGSTTAGADGNVSTFYLPGNIRTMISGIGVYYPDGSETQRIGIIPDVEIHPTITGIRNGEDELLNKAIEIIN